MVHRVLRIAGGFLHSEYCYPSGTTLVASEAFVWLARRLGGKPEKQASGRKKLTARGRRRWYPFTRYFRGLRIHDSLVSYNKGRHKKVVHWLMKYTLHVLQIYLLLTELKKLFRNDMLFVQCTTHNTVMPLCNLIGRFKSEHSR